MTRTKKALWQRVWVCFAAVLLATTSTSVAQAQEPTKTLTMHAAPKPVAPIQFEDGEGKPHSLVDFQGKFLLLNIWATWCVPCRKEMPALDRLQALFDARDF